VTVQEKLRQYFTTQKFVSYVGNIVYNYDYIYIYIYIYNATFFVRHYAFHVDFPNAISVTASRKILMRLLQCRNKSCGAPFKKHRLNLDNILLFRFIRRNISIKIHTIVILFTVLHERDLVPNLKGKK